MDCVRGNHTLMFLSLSFSLPSPLSKNKLIKKEEEEGIRIWLSSMNPDVKIRKSVKCHSLTSLLFGKVLFIKNAIYINM